ncbi:MAG TPA: hypothetical protein VGP76_10445 [Planctomycetaceae bacterium]|jgi:hypothetical protein|nr:hypothetical protein [Planctomycetaceae bacterium]
MDVLARVVVAGLRRPRKTHHGFLLRRAQIAFRIAQAVEGFTKRSRSGFDQLCESLAVGAVIRFQIAATQSVSHVDQELIRLERLDQIAVSPQLEIVGKNSKSTGSDFGIDCLEVAPPDL